MVRTVNRPLDAKSRQLLGLLDQEARAPLTHLAKKLRLSKQAVHHRIRVLKEKNILKQTFAVINLARLGYTQYKIYFNTKPLTAEDEEAFFAKLHDLPGLTWAAACRGRWDYALTFFAQNTSDFHAAYQDFLARGDHLITEKELQTVQSSTMYSRGYLSPHKKKFFYLQNTTTVLVNLDDKDRLLLKSFSEEARRPVQEHAAAAGLSRTATAARIKRLEREGVLLGHRAFFDLKAVQRTNYKICLSLKEQRAATARQLEAYTEQHLAGVQALFLVGRYDVELEFETDDETIDEIVLALRTLFSPVLESYDVLRIKKDYLLRFAIP